MCLEVNALPGLSPVSLFPLALATAGITMEQFCDGRLAEAVRAAADRRIAGRSVLRPIPGAVTDIGRSTL
jgi:hypothetical protein